MLLEEQLMKGREDDHSERRKSALRKLRSHHPKVYNMRSPFDAFSGLHPELREYEAELDEVYVPVIDHSYEDSQVQYKEIKQKILK